MHRFQRWRDALQVATTESAVAGVMERYVDSLPFSVMEALPADCRVALTRQPLDVQNAAVTVLQAELFSKAEAEERQALHEVAHTFAAAALRITSLSSKYRFDD